MCWDVWLFARVCVCMCVFVCILLLGCAVGFCVLVSGCLMVCDLLVVRVGVFACVCVCVCLCVRGLVCSVDCLFKSLLVCWCVGV